MKNISKQQLKYFVILGALIVLLAIAVSVAFGQSHRAGVTIYLDGNSTYVSATSPYYRALASLIEHLFMTPSNALPEGITSAILKELTTSGTSIELVYDHPTTLVQTYNTGTSTFQVGRLLVRLDGTHKGWMLYGKGQYQSGPFVTTDTQTITRLERLISDVY